jgi:hypothetical protein
MAMVLQLVVVVDLVATLQEGFLITGDLLPTILACQRHQDIYMTCGGSGLMACSTTSLLASCPLLKEAVASSILTTRGSMCGISSRGSLTRESLILLPLTK